MEKNLKKEKKYVCKKQKTKSLCCLPETMWINYTSFKKEKDKVKHNKISKADNYYWATKNEGIKLLKKKKGCFHGKYYSPNMFILSHFRISFSGMLMGS